MAIFKTQPFWTGPVNDGEKKLFEFLHKTLDSTFIIIPNCNLVNKRPNDAIEVLEYDCIVVAPHAIYHIENKHYFGNIKGDDSYWRINALVKPNPISSCSYKSKVLASILKQKNSHWKEAYVNSVISISDLNTTLDIDGRSREVIFKLNEDFLTYLNDPYRGNGFKDRIKEHQAGIAEFLCGFKEKIVIKKIFEKDYQVVEKAKVSSTVNEYIVIPKNGILGDKRKIKEYRVDNFEQLDKFNHHLITQKLVGFNNPITYVETLIDIENRYFYEVSKYFDENTLKIAISENKLDYKQKVEVLKKLIDALAILHKHGIIHRDLNSDNVFLYENLVLIGGLGKAYIVNKMDSEATVLTKIEHDGLTPYQPLELIGSEHCLQTDLYSVGIILYEMFIGILPIENCFELDKIGGLLPVHKRPKTIKLEIDNFIDELIFNLIKVDKKLRPNSCEEIKINYLSKLGEQKEVKMIQQGYTEGGYTFYEKIGKGGCSEVWKVKSNLHDHFKAMKIFNSDVPLDLIRHEYELVGKIKHENIVKVEYTGQLNDKRFWAIMEYLEGKNLHEYVDIADLRLPLEKIKEMSVQILNAIIELHKNNIIHRDIKPSNIMEVGERYVLIDFNVSSNNADNTWIGTNKFIPPDLRNGNEINWNLSADIFALGVTIFALVEKAYPWEQVPSLTIIPKEIRNNKISEKFKNFIYKSISTKTEDRWQSAEEMLNELIKIETEKREESANDIIDVKLTEKFVLDLRNTFSQSDNNNQTKGLTDFAVETYCKTKLDEALMNDVINGKFRLIIITGNAGDGKTTFIQNIEKELENKNVQIKEKDKNQKQFNLNGHNYLTNYDGSQDISDTANVEVLNNFFEIFKGDNVNFNELKEGRIIAINEGRLYEFLMNNNDYKFLFNAIDKFFNEEGANRLPEGMLIINLNQRSLIGSSVQSDEKSLFSKQLSLIINHPIWNGCSFCEKREYCHINFNRSSLVDSNNGQLVINRLNEILKTVHLSQELHITIRDLRSFISYLITHNFSCAQISENISDEEFIKRLYFNITDLSLNDAGNLDRLIKLIRKFDVGEVANPKEDRQLFYNEINKSNYLTFAKRLIDVHDKLNKIKEKELSQQKEIRSIQRVLRRFHYCESKEILRSNPYKYFEKFTNCLMTDLDNEDENRKILELVSETLALADGFKNQKISKKFVVLFTGEKDHKSASYRFFSLSDFEIISDTKPSVIQYIEFYPLKVIFRHKEYKDISIPLSLDLFEMLKHIEGGFLPSINDLKGKFIELQIFQNLLANLPYNDLYLTHNYSDFYHLNYSEEESQLKFFRLKESELCQ